MLPELGGERLPTRRFVSTYHDTPDFVLARHGVTFRHRVEDGAGLWQLKLPEGRRTARARGSRPARAPARRACSRSCSPTSAEQRRRPGRPAAHAARGRARSTGRRSSTTASPCSRGSGSSRRFREVEVELSSGDETRAAPAREGAAARGRRDAEGELLPKLHRALGLAGARDGAPSHGADTRRARRSGIALAEQRRRLLLHDPGTRLGDGSRGSPSASRRDAAVASVSAARHGRWSSPSWAESLRSELAWLGQTLGPARDLDVLLERLAADVESLDVDSRFRPRAPCRTRGGAGAAARRQFVEVLSSERYLALLDRLDQSRSRSSPLRQDPERDRCCRVAPSRRHVESAPSATPTDEALHASRIANQAGALRRRAGRARAGGKGPEVRRARQGAAGHPRRAPGRRRCRGADPGLGGHRRPRAASPAGGSCRSSASGSTRCGAAWRRGLGCAAASPARPLRMSALIRAAGGVPVRELAGELRGARRPSGALRRLDVPEGQVRAGRDRRGVRRPGGRGGDGAAVRPRRGAPLDVLHRRAGPSQDRPLLVDAAWSGASSPSTTRSTGRGGSVPPKRPGCSPTSATSSSCGMSPAALERLAQ